MTELYSVIKEEVSSKPRTAFSLNRWLSYLQTGRDKGNRIRESVRNVKRRGMLLCGKTNGGRTFHRWPLDPFMLSSHVENGDRVWHTELQLTFSCSSPAVSLQPACLVSRWQEISAEIKRATEIWSEPTNQANYVVRSFTSTWISWPLTCFPEARVCVISI